MVAHDLYCCWKKIYPTGNLEVIRSDLLHSITRNNLPPEMDVGKSHKAHILLELFTVSAIFQTQLYCICDAQKCFKRITDLK